MRNSVTILGVLLLAVSTSPAQQTDKQYWNWYFGNQAAIGFTSQSLPPVEITTSAMYANEGASAISDSVGNILFYSDGQMVWNSQNLVMPNGTGLKGHYWSAQSVLIVKMPGSDSLYYIFTVNNWTDAVSELNYSIIDKTLNGGLGDVTAQKNILVNDNCREHLTAAYHANGTDIWIMSHEFGNNHFVAYLLTSQGIDTIPVVSAAGAIYDGANRFGYMRVSSHCNRIATTLGKQGEMNIPDTTAQVFDFDNGTGIVSNGVFIADLTTMESAYCCEFSPDNSKVYFSEFNSQAIYQVDLNSPNPVTTLSNISTSASGTNASLTLGPDDKIYVTKAYANFLGAINSPNLPGSLSDHVDNALMYTMNNNTIGTCNILKRCTQFTGQYNIESHVPALSIYPNPASGSVSISFSEELCKTGSCADRLLVMDVTGRVIYTRESPGEPAHIIDTRDFSPGIYLILIETGHKTFTNKLVLE